MQEEFSLAELAVKFGLTLRGEPELKVRSVATLSRAEPGGLSFLANSRYRRQLEATRATVVLVSPEDEAQCPVAALIDQAFSCDRNQAANRACRRACSHFPTFRSRSSPSTYSRSGR